MPGAVVIGLFCTYFTPIQVVTTVEGQTDCYDTLYCPTRSNTQRANFLAFIVKVNSYSAPRSIVDQGETCSDELFAAWFFQVQQILSKTRVDFNKDQRHS